MIEGDFDVSAGYSNPWYSDGYYVKTEAAANLRAGGDIHIQFNMWMVNLHFWIGGILADF